MQILHNKISYKIFLYLLKRFPIITSIGYISNTILSYLGIECEWLSNIFGVSLLPFILIVLASYAFELCAFYKLYLFYIFVTDMINIYNYYIGIPLETKELYVIHLIFTLILLCILLYLHIKKKLI